eukprot:g13107.t1
MSPSYAEERELIVSPPGQEASYRRHGHLRAGGPLPPPGGESSKTSRGSTAPLLPASRFESDVTKEAAAQTPGSDATNIGGAKIPRSPFLDPLSPRKFVSFLTKAIGFSSMTRPRILIWPSKRGGSY